MKIRKLLTTAGIIAMSALVLSACSSNNNKSETAKIPTKIDKKTTVVFWHGMHGKQLATLKDITNDFEKEKPKYQYQIRKPRIIY